jgi:Flp pilus assembly protein TadG
VEFTIVIPAFLLLVAGMFDFGFGLYTDLTIINAAREGARMGVLDPGNATAIQARVSEAADNLDAARMSVTVSCRRPAGSSFVGCTAPLWQPGDATVVKVDYRYSMIFPLLFGTELPLSSEVAMRIE